MQDHEGCHGDGTRQEGMYHLHDVESGASISVASSELDAGVWQRRLGHMSEKGMKVMLSKDKLSGLKSLDLDFCKDCVSEKQRRVSFSKVRKTSKAERLELVLAQRPSSLVLMMINSWSYVY